MTELDAADGIKRYGIYWMAGEALAMRKHKKGEYVSAALPAPPADGEEER